MKPFIISVVLFTTLLHVQAFPKKIEYGGRVDKPLLFLNHPAKKAKFCWAPSPPQPCVIPVPAKNWTRGFWAISTGLHFTIDLLKKNNPKGNVLYRFDALENFSMRKYTVIQNSRTNGIWGRWKARKYNKADWPFPRGKEFEIRFTRTLNEIKVEANGQHVVTWDKIIPFDEIRDMYIWPGLNITKWLE